MARICGACREVARATGTLVVMLGLLCCSENLPDLKGHAHAHAPCHLMEPWHDDARDDLANGGRSGGGGNPSHVPQQPVDFHTHVSYDFSSVVIDLLGGSVKQHWINASHAGIEMHDERVPDAPCYELENPPLI